MKYNVKTNISDLSIMITKYYYRPKGNQKKNVVIDEDGQKWIISTEPLENYSYEYVDKFIITYDTEEFRYKVINHTWYSDDEDGDVVIDELLPNLAWMEEDELFQQSLIFKNENFSFDDVLKIQKWLIMRHKVLSTMIAVEI